MKSSPIVVLALSGLAAAAPEADPQLFLNAPAAALPFAAAPSLYNAYPYNSLYAPRFAQAAPVIAQQVYQPAPVVAQQVYQAAPVVAQQVYQAAPVVAQQVYQAAPLPLAAPFLRAAAPLHAAPVAAVQSIAPISPYRRAGDCATAEGCAVRDLIDAGLAGHKISRRSADAEADPQFLNFGLASPYAAAAVSPYAGLYSPYAAAPLYNNLYNNNLYNNLAYNNYNLGYAANAPLLNYAAAPALNYAAAPVIQAAAPLAIAAPVAPVVAQQVYAAAPAPIVVKAAPLPLPLVRRQPVVERTVKKVTYTHIGKHPVNPTDVFETSERVLY